MIETIRILISSIGHKDKYIIDCKKLELNYNESIKKIKEEDIFQILNFIYNWEDEYKSNFIIDGEEFFIEVISKEGIKKYHGKGDYPENYYLLKEFLEELV